MSKKLLIKYSTLSQTEIAEKISAREFVLQTVENKLYLGGNSTLNHIINEDYANTIIEYKIINQGIVQYNSTMEDSEFPFRTIVFDTDYMTLSYKDTSGVPIRMARKQDLLSFEPISIQVTSENISSTDSSVTLSNFSRPSILVFVDGIHCTNHPSSAKRYEYNPDDRTVKVFGCVENSVITYY